MEGREEGVAVGLGYRSVRSIMTGGGSSRV